MEATAQSNKENILSIDVSYQPASDLKTTTATGVMSSLTPDRLINIAFYTERRSFPISTQISVVDGQTKEGDDVYKNPTELVREINTSIIVDEATAQFIIDNLSNTLESIRKARKKFQDSKTNPS